MCVCFVCQKFTVACAHAVLCICHHVCCCGSRSANVLSHADLHAPAKPCILPCMRPPIASSLHPPSPPLQASWRQTALSMHTAKVVPQASIAAAGQPLPSLSGLQSLFLYKRWYRGHVDLGTFVPTDTRVQRV